MSSSGKAGSGHGNRRRPFRRRSTDIPQEGDSSGRSSGGEAHSGKPQEPARGNNPPYRRSGENIRGDRVSYSSERPKWIPPKTNTEPLPVSDCLWCGKPIRDMSSAIADKDTGSPVHFDCVTSRIAFAERLEKGDSVAYIGGGRFAVISSGALSDHLQVAGRGSPAQSRSFVIKKIIEWENKDKRAEWRSVICDHYSVT